MTLEQLQRNDVADAPAIASRRSRASPPRWRCDRRTSRRASTSC